MGHLKPRTPFPHIRSLPRCFRTPEELGEVVRVCLETIRGPRHELRVETRVAEPEVLVELFLELRRQA